MRLFAALSLAAALAGLSGCAQAQVTDKPATLVSQFDWTERVSGWGGFSAIDVSEDGARITLLSDRNLVVTGTLQRDAQGRIFDVGLESTGLLRGVDGSLLESNEWRDAEGIAALPGGGHAVSFERRHRVVVYPTLDAPTQSLPSGPFPRLQNNSGLEALAIDGEGRLLAIPERSGQLERPFPVWRLEQGAWVHRYDVPRQPPYLVAGAEVGPDGRLYVLERHFTGLAFGTRVRSFAMGNAALTDARTVIPAEIGLADNAEGIDLWRGADGRLRIILIADDNFSFFQRNLISEFVLD